MSCERKLKYNASMCASSFSFFDRAATVTHGDSTSGGAPRAWRVSTVHRVEELKSIVRMLPIWGAGILLVTSASHNHSFAIQQARTMDRRVTPRLEIPPASMLIFSNLAMLGTLALYDRVLVPRLRRLTGRPAGITHLQRTGIGLAISTLSNAVSAVVEARRKRAAARHGLLDSPGATVPMSVLWMAPQYAIHGVADAFMDVGRMEFLYDQAPESMRSSAGSLYTYKKLEIVDQESTDDTEEKHLELQPLNESDEKDVELRPLLSADL